MERNFAVTNRPLLLFFGATIIRGHRNANIIQSPLTQIRRETDGSRNLTCYPFARVSPNWCFSSMAGRCTRSCSRFIAAGRSSAAATRRTSRSPMPARCDVAVRWADADRSGRLGPASAAAAAAADVSSAQGLMHRRFGMPRRDHVPRDFSLEPVARETFWTYQKELTQIGAARACCIASNRAGGSDWGR